MRVRAYVHAQLRGCVRGALSTDDVSVFCARPDFHSQGRFSEFNHFLLDVKNWYVGLSAVCGYATARQLWLALLGGAAKADFLTEDNDDNWRVDNASCDTRPTRGAVGCFCWGGKAFNRTAAEMFEWGREQLEGGGAGFKEWPTRRRSPAEAVHVLPRHGFGAQLSLVACVEYLSCLFLSASRVDDNEERVCL